VKKFEKIKTDIESGNSNFENYKMELENKKL